MSRTLRSSLAAFLAIGLAAISPAGSAALAQSVTTLPSTPEDDSVAVAVQVADLATAAGRAAARDQLEAAADAYCRGHPGVATTVTDCRRDFATRLIQGVEATTGYALGPPG